MEKELWKPGNMLYPIPAVMVSCQDEEHGRNIITVAWTGTMCTNPPMVYISIKPERYSYNIIRNSGEFVINLTTEGLAKAVDYCGVRSGRDVDKFKEMNLTPADGRIVKVPVIAESPVNIECRVAQILEQGSHHVFIAEVVGVNIDPKYMDKNGRFCLNDAKPLVYSHGSYYGLGSCLGTFGYSVRKPKKKKRK